MAWFLSLASGMLILLFVCSRLYIGYTNLERSIESRAEAGLRVPPDDHGILRLRKNGFWVSLAISTGLIALGILGYAHKSAGERSRVTNTEEPGIALIPVPSDKGANYWLVSKRSSGGLSEIVIRRNGGSGTSYSNRAYNCAQGKVKYLGDGSTLAEMQRSAPDANMSDIVPGSIAYYVGQEACR